MSCNGNFLLHNGLYKRGYDVLCADRLFRHQAIYYYFGIITYPHKIAAWEQENNADESNKLQLS